MAVALPAAPVHPVNPRRPGLGWAGLGSARLGSAQPKPARAREVTVRPKEASEPKVAANGTRT